MSDLIPSPWEFALASLAVYRLWRLLAEDEILEVPRRHLLRYVGWEEGQPVPDGYRVKWRDFLVCPWCCGFWLSVLAWLFWLAAPTAALLVATPFAVSCVVGLIRVQLDPPEE